MATKSEYLPQPLTEGLLEGISYEAIAKPIKQDMIMELSRAKVVATQAVRIIRPEMSADKRAEVINTLRGIPSNALMEMVTDVAIAFAKFETDVLYGTEEMETGSSWSARSTYNTVCVRTLQNIRGGLTEDPLDVLCLAIDNYFLSPFTPVQQQVLRDIVAKYTQKRAAEIPSFKKLQIEESRRHAFYAWKQRIASSDSN